MTTFSVLIGNELYIYILGRLVMKRWIDTRVSATFHINPNGVRWSADKPYKGMNK